MLEITPKKKSPLKALFLLSVIPQEFPAIPTCHSTKHRCDWFDSEEYEPLIKELSHKMRGLKITPSSIVGLGAHAVYE